MKILILGNWNSFNKYVAFCKIICMLSLEKCKEILEKNGGNDYTDEQVEKIREILYRFAAIDYDVFKNKKYNTSLSTNGKANSSDTKKD